MKLSDLTSAEQVKAEALKNPAVRAEWDRTAVAGEVAHRVLRYRVEHGLSQTEMGSRLGVSQPYVAKLERGDQAPSLATLVRLARRLGLEFHIDVTPTTVRLSAPRAPLSPGPGRGAHHVLDCPGSADRAAHGVRQVRDARNSGDRAGPASVGSLHRGGARRGRG